MTQKGPARLSGLARAKINLGLRILGRRPDGYHALESLAAFTDFGDRLTLEVGPDTGLDVEGPFAAMLDPGNLVAMAAQAFLHKWPDARGGRFILRKNLPIAAGIGGGSADAAAALNLLARANPGIRSEEHLPALAASIGADVPVCLVSRASFMSGVGERVKPLERFPAVHAVLANPGVRVPTARVFAVLDAPRLADEREREAALPSAFATLEEVVHYVKATGNDLAAAAVATAPVVANVLEALAATQGALATALTGSGATCFALYEERAGAERAATALGKAQPEWWVKAVTLS
ncbi:MAG: 4-(cytidine 5'-diphospho)-2-C-methyl-D-erythritol kinase [Alphaproteobacteria bacterium]|nr:MAG: 4-(cytidine 5'-diphospho)-2-C-methyl-D-erythritol kinase [Alphaproteobacteria bacterium]